MPVNRPIIGLDASRSYRTPMTGTERYSARVIEGLINGYQDEFEYRLYFNDAPPSYAKLGTADTRVIPARRFWTHVRLSRELRDHPVNALFVPAHVIPLIHPERSIITVHDLGFFNEPSAHTARSRLQLRMTTRWNANRAHHIIAISHATKRDLIKHYRLDSDRVTVIHHGVDERFQPLPTEQIDRYRAAARLPERFILYLGTIQPRKNLVRLIEAFEMIAIDQPELNLVLAGNPGWLTSEIIQRATSSHVSARIRFLGRVPDEQLALLYNAASAFAMPSLYEGFGMPALEAMACGLPTVVSDRGALPEVAGADSKIVNPLHAADIANGIALALESRDDPHQVTERVRHATSFSWNEATRKTFEVLRDSVFG
jgi:glycosyltransferase involved in cell wall biosynthesis